MTPGAGHASAGPPGRAAAEPRWQRRVAVGILFVAWLAFVFPAFTGKARFPLDLGGPIPGHPVDRVHNAELGDALFAFYPWHSHLGATLRAGHVPLWDPYRFAGTPFAANITVGTWYPPNWLYASERFLATFTLIAIGSILAALLLSYWFFRVLELHPFAATLGSIVFVFSAFFMKWNTNEAVSGSALWLPLVLGGLEVARRGRVRRGVVLAALGLAFSVLAGHAQVALLVWAMAAVWAAVGIVASMLTRHRDRSAPGSVGRALVRAALPPVSAFVLAGALAAVQIVPTAAFAGQIVRQRTDLSLARRTALAPQSFPTALIPDYHGNPVDGNYTGKAVNYTETALYAGLVTLLLAGYGAVRGRGRTRVFFLVVTVGGVLAVIGTPLYRLVLATPGFSRTLWVTRFILFIDFGLAGLAALGLHRLLTGPDRRALPWLLGSAAGLLTLVAALTVSRVGTDAAAGYVTGRGVRAAALLLIGAAALGALVRYPRRAAPLALALVAVTYGDLWLFGFRFNPFQERRPVFLRTPAVEAVAAGPGARPRYATVGGFWLPPNAELVYRIHGIGGYDPFVPQRMAELLGVLGKQRSSDPSNYLGPFEASAVDSPILDLLGVTTLLGSPDGSLGSPPRLDGEFRVYDRPTAFPPVWIASCSEVVPAADVLDRLSSMTSTELAGTAVLTGPGPNISGSDGAGCRQDGRARLARYEPERVEVRAEAASPGILVLNDAWFPGWKATVDGKEVRILRVDHALRGVALGPGSHTVVFSFRPASAVVGGAVTLSTLLGLLAWGVVARVARRDRPGDRPSWKAPPTGRFPDG